MSIVPRLRNPDPNWLAQQGCKKNISSRKAEVCRGHIHCLLCPDCLEFLWLFLFSLAAACFLPASICNFLQRVFLGLLETLANPESWDCPRVYTSYEQPTLGSGRVGKSSSLASNQEQFTLQRSHKIRLRLGVPCSASPLVLSLLPYYLTRFSWNISLINHLYPNLLSGSVFGEPGLLLPKEGGEKTAE